MTTLNISVSKVIDSAILFCENGFDHFFQCRTRCTTFEPELLQTCPGARGQKGLPNKRGKSSEQILFGRTLSEHCIYASNEAFRTHRVRKGCFRTRVFKFPNTWRARGARFRTSAMAVHVWTPHGNRFRTTCFIDQNATIHNITQIQLLQLASKSTLHLDNIYHHLSHHLIHHYHYNRPQPLLLSSILSSVVIVITSSIAPYPFWLKIPGRVLYRAALPIYHRGPRPQHQPTAYQEQKRWRGV